MTITATVNYLEAIEMKAWMNSVTTHGSDALALLRDDAAQVDGEITVAGETFYRTASGWKDQGFVLALALIDAIDSGNENIRISRNSGRFVARVGHLESQWRPIALVESEDTFAIFEKIGIPYPLDWERRERRRLEMNSAISAASQPLRRLDEKIARLQEEIRRLTTELSDAKSERALLAAEVEAQIVEIKNRYEV
jgi:hypothetical protein